LKKEEIDRLEADLNDINKELAEIEKREKELDR